MCVCVCVCILIYPTLIHCLFCFLSLFLFHSFSLSHIIILKSRELYLPNFPCIFMKPKNYF